MGKTYKLTHARLLELLSYNKKTGVFSRRIPVGMAKAGPLSTKLRPNGYYEVSLDNEQILLHRLAWFYVTGRWPEGEIDHKNTDKTCNRWSNLRDVPHRLNQQNRSGANSNSRLGIPGVSKPYPGGGFRAQIRLESGTKYLGSYPTAAEASRVFQAAKRKAHPNLPRRKKP